MATILSNKKSSGGSPYCYYTVEVTTSNRTASQVTVNVTVKMHLASSSSYLGSGYYVKVHLYVAGAWHEATIKGSSASWSGTKTHSKSFSFTVSAAASATALTGIQFKATANTNTACKRSAVSCSNIAISSVTAPFASCTMSVGSITQKDAVATINSLPASAGVANEVRWYLGSTHLGTVSRAASGAATSLSRTITGLEPSKTYTAYGYVYSGGVLLRTISAAFTTPEETGTISAEAGTSLINISVNGMTSAPNYTRTVEFSYKSASDTEYVLLTTDTSGASTVGALATGLRPGTQYNIKAVIKNGATVLKTLTSTVTTTNDVSAIPTPSITALSQVRGTTNISMVWTANKNVSGTSYLVQIKKGSGSWENYGTLSGISSPYTINVTIPSGTENMNVSVKITASNPSVAVGSNTSLTKTITLIGDFVWDYEKVQGQPIVITANEWNRLAGVVEDKCSAAGIYVTIPRVRTGQQISHSTYNTMKNTIKRIGTIDIADKETGDLIRASDINALKTAINAA